MSAGYQDDAHISLKLHLMRRGLSQRRIARELGITVQYLNDILQRRRKAPKLRNRLVEEFEIPAEYLLIEGRTAA